MNVSECSRVERGLGSDGLHVLKGALICALALSAGAPFFRAVLAVLAGRALAAGIVKVDGTRCRPVRGTVLFLAGIWIGTLSPVVLFGNPDVIRSSVAAALLVLLLRGLPARSTIALSGVLLVAAAAAAGAPPHSDVLGEVEYAVGATWPRGWSDVAAAAGLFLLGSGWAGMNRPHPRVLDRHANVLVWLEPLGSLGRMPITAVLLHSLLTSTLRGSNAAVTFTPFSLALLLAETAAARWWLQTHERGPAEQALYATRAACAAVGIRVRKSAPHLGWPWTPAHRATFPS
jgi:hypothetical protein